MKLAQTMALAGAFFAAQSSFANGYQGDAWNGSGCTYPTSVVFTQKFDSIYGVTYYDYNITTNGITQNLTYYNEGAFWYGLNCGLPPYTHNQTLSFEMKGTNMFQYLDHAGVPSKMVVNGNQTQMLAEGPIFWGPNSYYRPIIAGPLTPVTQIEKFAWNTQGRTQGTYPDSIAPVALPDLSAFPNGAPSIVDGVTYRVWVDANLTGTQIWVLDPNGNSAVPSTWMANVIKHWSANESVYPEQFGVGFFAIPNPGTVLPVGAKLEFTNISVSN